MTVDVRGFGKGDLSTQRQLLVKNTLEWRLVYKFEMWVMRHNTEINVVLGMDFMIPVGVRLDLYRSTAMLPREIMLSLLKLKKMENQPVGRASLRSGPPNRLTLVRTSALALVSNGIDQLRRLMRCGFDVPRNFYGL
ncbi:hypothetical protein L914_12405 [Phytophthora nicotianae]|uniref:Uncharacterized protein n=1 Tax=Phytophthora nicotianae TaxID=4792 RepID=W2N1X1_PHYNI|nr:hypothetical protein L914_12405 [Phytophthora nicotianae]